MRLRRSQVERLRRTGDVEALVRLARSPDVVRDSDGRTVDLEAPERAAAVRALGEHDERRAIDTVTDALADPIMRVRLAALETIEGHPRQEQCAGLARVLTTWPADQRSLRERALALLLRCGDIWLAVFHAEALLDAHGAGDLAPSDAETLRRLADLPDEEGVLDAFARRQAERLSASEEHVRRRVGAVLAALGPPALGALVDALDDPERKVAAARALGMLRDTRAIAPLARLLDDDDPALRVIAAVGLGRVRHPATAEALVRASLDERAEVRDAAQAALDELGTAGVLAGMAAVLGPMAQRLEQLEQARNGAEAAGPAAPLLRRLLERRARG